MAADHASRKAEEAPPAQFMEGMLCGVCYCCRSSVLERQVILIRLHTGMVAVLVGEESEPLKHTATEIAPDVEAGASNHCLSQGQSPQSRVPAAVCYALSGLGPCRVTTAHSRILKNLMDWPSEVEVS